MDVDAVKKAISADALKDDITSRKAVDFVKENAVITEEKAAAKKTAEKKETAEKKPAAKKETAKKETAKKPAAKKTTKKAADAE